MESERGWLGYVRCRYCPCGNAATHGYCIILSKQTHALRSRLPAYFTVLCTNTEPCSGAQPNTFSQVLFYGHLLTSTQGISKSEKLLPTKIFFKRSPHGRTFGTKQSITKYEITFVYNNPIKILKSKISTFHKFVSLYITILIIYCNAEFLPTRL